MKIPGFTFLVVVVILLASFISLAQSTDESKVFDEDSLKFSYPADWTIVDKSNSETQHLLITKKDGSTLFVIVSPRVLLENLQQFRRIQRSVYQNYVTAIPKSLTSNNKAPTQEFLCLDFNGRNVSGTKFSGLYNNEPSQGEVYTFALGRRVLALIYMKTIEDSSQSDIVWQKLINSIYLDGSNKNALSPFDSNILIQGSLNGKSKKLVVPVYTEALRKAGAFGSVVVEIEIDETGKVITADSILGDKLLFSSAENAAKKSKFPVIMICDKAIKTRGTIIYNFPLPSDFK